ncbi:MAG TPA: hypothetical protein VI279_03150 [Rhodocyclaceae bacterium]
MSGQTPPPDAVVAAPLGEADDREAQVRQQVAHLFRHAGDHAVVERLREVVVAYRMAAPEGRP